MVALLGEMRREMNGVAADAMYDAGVRGVLNYGVSIPTIRDIAGRTGHDHSFAKFLYRQQVRELRMAAVSIAEPELVTAGELQFWLEGNPSVELLDELAMRLICRSSVIGDVVGMWLECGDAPARYAAMMSLARAAGYDVARVLRGTVRAIEESPDDMRLARAAVFLLGSIAAEADRADDVRRAAAALPESRAGRHVREEMAWMVG